MKRNDMTSNAASRHACTLGCRAAIARTLLPLVLAASLVGAASAAVVFEQAPADGNDAFFSISAAQSADGFVLSTTTSVSGLTWWGSYLEDPADPATPWRKDDFSARFFEDDGSGTPAATPTEEAISQQPIRSLTGLKDVTGAPVYRFDLALTPFSVAAGTKWYLSVINKFDVGDSDAAWFWSQSQSDSNGENFHRVVDTDPWSSALTGNLAFGVNGNPETPIPLPGSLVLILTGLAGLNLRLPGRRSPNQT